VPVISVGSANARSPGRTSTVAWIAERLARSGHRVGVALRGYRRQHAALATSWDQLADVAHLGDEGSMLAARGHAVAAATRRGEAVDALVRHGCTVVLLDDGRQSTEVARDLDVEVIDGRYPGARGLLPMGERRTRTWGDGEVCLVHHPEAWPERPEAHIAVRRRVGPWRRGGRPAPSGPGGAVAVWLGVGHPEEVLGGLDVPVAAQRIHPDHSRPPDDLATWLQGRPLVCTEKDRVRLPASLAAVAWTRTVELEVEDDAWLAPFLRGSA
jgi:tetraacyldisaccharide 4'-kinase